ncbi:MAG: hypothetical protein HY547_08855 [Elusimicrobia bacterium]|nr:hypothetical protein [Elusimicrobiota bacterium]
MRLNKKVFVVFIGLGMLAARIDAAEAKTEKSSFEAEKAKAEANPYANDMGPKEVDVSSYPKEIQAGYTLLQNKCSKCHSPARPLNSQFLEPTGEKSEERAAKMAKWKKDNPDLFTNKLVWQPEADIWQRYVKRMMSKPGCEISNDEGKKIWKFLVHDGNERKIGADKDKWAQHRKKLLEDFKVKHPARYKELYGTASSASADKTLEKTEKKPPSAADSEKTPEKTQKKSGP